MSSPWSLVTPASRGIGLAIARHLLRTTRSPVVATARGDVEQTREAILKDSDTEGESPLDGDAEKRLQVLKLDVLGT